MADIFRDDNNDNIINSKKPPIGIMPKRIWQKKRFEELRLAMLRYLDADLKLSQEWIDEYHELLTILGID